MWAFGGLPVAINLAALHPDPGARAPGPTPRNQFPGRVGRQTQRCRAAGEMAMVATAVMFPAIAGGRGFESRPLRCRQLVEQETLNLLVRALIRRTTNLGHYQRRPRSLVPELSTLVTRGAEGGIRIHVPELPRSIEPTPTLWAERGGDRLLPRREGFEPSQRRGHSPLKAVTALSEQRILSPLLREPAGHRPFTAVTGIRMPLGTPPGARKCL